ncbi:hypothetical protein PCANC_13081 [Puccinia coronata f. sp. avenae]|uniref:Uncharacterized protein n=1 Tax=Puccinia coronata f. sp. avenae TaxID=200324 RepID=A0A2N5UUR6_9BASI|nr:hypothetical protein PCANC_13081 [Puccinia coronata f. sp. avenae]
MKHADAGTACPRWPRHSALQPLLKHPTALGQHPALIQHLHLTSPLHSHGSLHLYGTHTYKGSSSLLVLLHKQQMSVGYLRSPSLLFDSENSSQTTVNKRKPSGKPQLELYHLFKSLPTSWQYTRWAGEPPNLALRQLGGRASRPAGFTPACRESLPTSWHYTRSAGEPPDKLALHQLSGRASRPASTTPARRESLPASWNYTSSSGEPPGKLELQQLVGRASRQAGTTPARGESLPEIWNYTSSWGEPPGKLV